MMLLPCPRLNTIVCRRIPGIKLRSLTRLELSTVPARLVIKFMSLLALAEGISHQLRVLTSEKLSPIRRAHAGICSSLLKSNSK